MHIFVKLLRTSKFTNFYRGFSNQRQLNKCISLNVIGSGALGESPSICLSIANNENYLFNCGEDCQRLLTQRQIKISTIKHIFVTQTKWHCIGGISMVGRTINNAKGWLPKFHGPKQLYKCIKRILCLSILSELDFRPIDCNSKGFFENDHLRIEFVSIKANEQNDQQKNMRDIHEVLLFIVELKAKTASMDSELESRPNFMSMNTIFCRNFKFQRVTMKQFVCICFSNFSY